MNNKKLLMFLLFSVYAPALLAGKEKKRKHLSAPVKSSIEPEQNLFEVFHFLDQEKESNNNDISAGFAAYLQHLISCSFQNKTKKLE